MNRNTRSRTTSQWEDAALFEYEGEREIERTQAPYDLVRSQTWTSFREPQVLKYEKDSTNALLTGLEYYWDGNSRMVARARSHDEGTYEWGEVFRYDDMDRRAKVWRNVQDPSNYPSTDPTDASSTFDDRVSHTLGKVHERDNVKVKPDGGTETTTEYTNNSLYQYTDIGGQTQTWDSNGQLTDNGPWAFTWTALGQVELADPDSGTDREYLYDAFGRRVQSKVGSQEWEYLYLGWHMIGEYDETADEWLWQEIPRDDGEGMLEHIALDTNDMDGDSDTTEYRAYGVHEDFQNTAWGLSDTAGAMLERYRYREPYGDFYTEDAFGSDIGDFASEVYHVKRHQGSVIVPEVEMYDCRNLCAETHCLTCPCEKDAADMCQDLRDAHARNQADGSYGNHRGLERMASAAVNDFCRMDVQCGDCDDTEWDCSYIDIRTCAFA